MDLVGFQCDVLGLKCWRSKSVDVVGDVLVRDVVPSLRAAGEVVADVLLVLAADRQGLAGVVVAALVGRKVTARWVPLMAGVANMHLAIGWTTRFQRRAFF